VNFLCKKGAAIPVAKAVIERDKSLASIKASREGLLKVEIKYEPPQGNC